MQENKIAIEQEKNEQEIEIERESKEREIEVEGENVVLNVLMDYQTIENKPQINGVELKAGNNTLEKLGIQKKGDYVTNQALEEKHYLTEHQDISNLATKDEIPDTKSFITKDIADLINYYDKDTVDGKITPKADKNYVDTNFAKTTDISNFIKKDVSNLENYYTKNDMDSKIENFITSAVDDLTNYYKKTETYTQEEINQRLSAIKTGGFKKVDQLPESGEENYIYLVPAEKLLENNIKDEFIWLVEEQKFEQIGSTQLDLDGYVTTEQLNQKLQDYVTNATLEEILREYAKASQIPDTSNFITDEEVDAKLLNKADKNEIPSLDNFYTKDETYSNVEIDEKIKEASGTDLSDYLKKEEANETYLDKATASSIYATKEEMPSLDGYAKTIDIESEYAKKEELGNLEGNIDIKFQDYATKGEIPDTKEFITKNVADLTNYYDKETFETKITDATTNLESQIEKNKQDLETEIGEQIAKITTLAIDEVTELPTQNISTTTIYLIKPENLPQDMVINTLSKKIVRDELVISPLDVNTIAQISISEEDYYLACFYTKNKWIVVGSTKTDLSAYAKKSEIPTKVSDLSNDLSFLQSSSSNYIKSLKISGKTITYTTGAGTTGTLTTQDTTYNVATTSSDGLMSSSDKSKLNGIASGANNYSLPTASSTTKGGIMVGDGLVISSGKLSTELTYEVVSTW